MLADINEDGRSREQGAPDDIQIPSWNPSELWKIAWNVTTTANSMTKTVICANKREPFGDDLSLSLHPSFSLLRRLRSVSTWSSRKPLQVSSRSPEPGEGSAVAEIDDRFLFSGFNDPIQCVCQCQVLRRPQSAHAFSLSGEEWMRPWAKMLRMWKRNFRLKLTTSSYFDPN